MALIDSLKFVQVIIDEANRLTATPEDVLVNKCFVGRAKKLEYGTIPIMDARTDMSLACGDSIIIPYGHNPQQFLISTVPLADQTPGNATVDDVLATKTCWVNGLLITGAMINNGAISHTLNAGEQYTVGKGYHNGSGIVKAATLADQTVGTAVDEDIRAGKIAWVNGVELVGSMTENPTVTITLQAGGEYTIAKGYHNGDSKIKAASLSSQTPGNATANDMAVGKTAWVNGVLITGAVPIILAEEHILPLNGVFEIPWGIHGGLGTVTQDIKTITGMVITPAFRDQTIDTTDRYFTDNITVTGIDTMNYSKTSDVYTGIGWTADSITAGTAKLKLSVDNWHDQLTTNIYQIAPKYTIGGTEITGDNVVIVISNLSTNLAVQKINLDYNITVTLKLDPDTNAHVFIFEFKGDKNGDNVSQLFVNVQNLLKFRQYGDDHDV